jgi:hypothetical protein
MKTIRSVHSFSPRKGKKADWLPKDIAARLTNLDEDLRTAAQSEARSIAEKVYDEAYFLRLRRLIRPQLPPGIPLPCEGGYGIPFDFHQCLAMSRQELADKAKEGADRMAEFEVDNAIEKWVLDYLSSIDSHPSRDVAGMLLAALEELNDAQAALNCVKIWAPTGHEEPPSWRKVDELIRANPGLVEFGLIGMIDRGYVPPPWVTTVIASW